MPEPAIDPTDFKSLDALLAQLPDMLAAAPKEEGRLDLIVMRWANSFKSKSHERLKDNLLAAGLPE